MPICTNCTHPTPYLYTVYNSRDNLRLEQCRECGAFADPYVEHDALTLWIDLILLKRDVFRHLLFNRGAGARHLSPAGNAHRAEELSPAATERQREKGRWSQIARLGLGLVAVDAFIRWSHIDPSVSFDDGRGTAHDEVARWNQDALEGYFRILVGCLIETLGFHLGVTVASCAVLHLLDRLRAHRRVAHAPSGLRQQFRCSHVPLTILYSSLNKFFLLFLLTIWRPRADAAGPGPARAPPHDASALLAAHPLAARALALLDDDALDRAWIVRNILGGLATGFGLRVVLDCPPLFTTLAILAGWAAKTALAQLVRGWVGAGRGVAEETWLAYSIP